MVRTFEELERALSEILERELPSPQILHLQHSQCDDRIAILLTSPEPNAISYFPLHKKS